MSEETSNFLRELQEYNEVKFTKEIYIPTLERTVKFSTLMAKHQDDIIQAALDNPILNVEFTQRVYKILKEICKEPHIIDSLSIFDKDAILIQMRYLFVSKTYNGVDLTKNIENIRAIRVDLSPKTASIDGLEIRYRIPTIKEEYDIVSQFKSGPDYKNFNMSDRSQVKKFVTEAYIMELVKFVSSATLLEVGSTMDFNRWGYGANKQVVNTFGRLVCEEIQEYIKTVKDSFSDMYKLDEENNIEINPSLFN